MMSKSQIQSVITLPLEEFTPGLVESARKTQRLNTYKRRGKYVESI